jgi:hypothetical protein
MIQFILVQSQPYPEALAFLAELARFRGFLGGSERESKELNEYRIEHHKLREPLHSLPFVTLSGRQKTRSADVPSGPRYNSTHR